MTRRTRSAPNASKGVAGWSLGAALLFALAGCDLPQGMQSGALPEHIHQIEIPEFANETAVVQVQSDLTQLVRRKVTEDGRLLIAAPGTGPQARLSGTIVRYALEPIEKDSGTGRVSRWRLRIDMRLVLTDLVNGKELWREPTNAMQLPFDAFYEFFDMGNRQGKTPETEEQARSKVADLLAAKVVARLFR